MKECCALRGTREHNNWPTGPLACGDVWLVDCCSAFGLQAEQNNLLIRDQLHMDEATEKQSLTGGLKISQLQSTEAVSVARITLFSLRVAPFHDQTAEAVSGKGPRDDFLSLSLIALSVFGRVMCSGESTGSELATRYGEMERRRRDGKALSVKESTPQSRVSQDAAAQCLHLDRAWMIIIILLLWTSCCEE